MKKILVLLLTVLIFNGCSNTTVETEKNKELQITDATSSMGEMNETLDKQKLSYEMTISNKGKLPVVEESIEIVLTDWINERLMENEITEKIFNEDNIMIKGYVIFDTKDLSKQDILENEPFIKGINISTEGDGERFLNIFSN